LGVALSIPTHSIDLVIGHQGWRENSAVTAQVMPVAYEPIITIFAVLELSELICQIIMLINRILF
jgi:hypothetical protein